MATKLPERKIAKTVTVIQVDAENVRGMYQNIPALANDIRESWKRNGEIRGILSKSISGGLAEPLDVEEMPDGKLHVRKGHRRCKALALLLAQYPKGYQPEGSSDIYEFDQVEVFIHRNLTDAERILLTADHGSRSSLDSVGLAKTAFALKDAGLSEKDIVNSLRTVLDEREELSAKAKLNMESKIADGVKEESAYLSARKGWIDARMHVYRCPYVVREAYLNLLAGKQNWPTGPEIDTLLGKYDAEAASDKTVSRKLPGPRFLEAWDALVQSKVDTGTGPTTNKSKAPKGTLGSRELEEMFKNSDSPMTRTMIGIVQNDIPRAVVKLYDTYQLAVGELVGGYDKMTPEVIVQNLVAIRAIADQLTQATSKPTPPAATTEPK